MINEIMSYTFAHNRNLQEVNIPAGVKNIGYGAFVGCSKLNTIDIPSSVDIIESFAFDKAGLVSVHISDGVKVIKDNVFFCNTYLTEIHLPDSVVWIDKCVFESCCALKSVRLPEGLTEINQRTFAFCNELQNITLPNGLKKSKTLRLHAVIN